MTADSPALPQPLAYGTHLLALRVDAGNFDAFQALIAPCRDDSGCDRFAAPDPAAVEAFLRHHSDALLPLLPGRRPLFDLDGRQIGQRQWFHDPAAPAALQPVAVPPRGAMGQRLLPQAEARRAAFEAALQGLVAADVDESGAVWMRLAELTDPEGDQLALFHRSGDGAWSVVHCHARAEADYMADLLDHPPVEGFELVRADRWGDGRVTVTRLFVVDGVPYALPMYDVLPDGAVLRGLLPEDAHAAEAVPVPHWLTQRYNAHGGHAANLDPRALDYERLLADQPSRFTIVKYSDTPDAVLGRYAAPAAAPALLEEDGWQQAGAALPALCLMPLRAEDLPALRQLVESVWSTPERPLDPAAAAAFARSAARLERLAGSAEGAALWSGAPFTLLPQRRPGVDALSPAAAQPCLLQAVATECTADGRIALNLAERPMPWPALLALHRPAAGGPVSAALVMPGANGLPASRCFGPGFAAVGTYEPASFVQQAMTRLLAERPATPAAPRRMAAPAP